MRMPGGPSSYPRQPGQRFCRVRQGYGTPELTRVDGFKRKMLRLSIIKNDPDEAGPFRKESVEVVYDYLVSRTRFQLMHKLIHYARTESTLKSLNYSDYL
jgi:hypothetical protein